MIPFRLICNIGTPMQLGSHPLHLDGLLYWLAESYTDKPISVLDTVLAKQDGIYKASALAFAPQPLEIVTYRSTKHPTCWSWNEWDMPLNAKSIVQKGGQYRARMTDYHSHVCSKVVFFGVGDIAKIKAIMATCNGLGRNSNQGMGEITSFEIEQMDHDYSWFMDDQLMRALPMSLIPASIDQSTTIEGMASIAPPYKSTATTQTLSPVFLKVSP